MSFRQARKNAGFSVKDVAAAFGVSATTVYAWEENRWFPRRRILLKLAEMYGYPVEDLLTASVAEEASDNTD